MLDLSATIVRWQADSWALLLFIAGMSTSAFNISCGGPKVLSTEYIHPSSSRDMTGSHVSTGRMLACCRGMWASKELCFDNAHNLE